MVYLFRIPITKLSLDAKEFGEVIRQVKDAEKALGLVNYELSEQQKRSRKITGRSLFVIKDLKKGEVLTEDNIRSVRPGYGLHPMCLSEVLNKKVKESVSEGTPLNWGFLE